MRNKWKLKHHKVAGFFDVSVDGIALVVKSFNIANVAGEFPILTLEIPVHPEDLEIEMKEKKA